TGCPWCEGLGSGERCSHHPTRLTVPARTPSTSHAITALLSSCRQLGSIQFTLATTTSAARTTATTHHHSGLPVVTYRHTPRVYPVSKGYTRIDTRPTVEPV